MNRIVVFLLLILCGCASAQRLERTPVRATEHTSLIDDEQNRAERVARQHAVSKLGLTERQVAKMKADLDGFSIEDGKILTIQFYDPKVIHPNSDGSIWAMDGGFPSYFRISVDTQSWQVVDDYASPE